MDHRLWLRLDEKHQFQQSHLDVIWSAGRSQEGLDVATREPFDSNFRNLAGISAGRSWNGFEYEQSVSFRQNTEDFHLSNPHDGESIIYGLYLSAELARRSFITLHFSEFDTKAYTPKELGL